MFISFSKKFADKFSQSIPALNEELYPFAKRVQLIENAKEVPSPAPRVSQNAIFIAGFSDLISRQFGGFLVDVTNTNSMDPWIDAGHKAVMIPFQSFPPFRKQDLQVGDIILFDRELDKAKNVLHRIESIGSNGKVVATRGDNTTVLDGKTAAEQIRYLCVGVIY